MDLIGSVNYIEGRLGERKFKQEKRKSAQKNTRIDAVDGNKDQADAHFAAEPDTQLGRKIDITV